jgi:hypothetical protein
MRARNAFGIALVTLLAAAPAARAHHEAIFGPQSSLVLSAPAFVSLQSFARSGAGGEESTWLLSAGFTPSSRLPLSLTLIASASLVSAPAEPDRAGLEDIVAGARWRQDLGEGSYLLGMAAIELPTGSMDHRPLRGPVDGMAALLAGVERGPFSAIGYVFHRRHGRDAAGARAGDLTFAGAGAAYTPWDSDDPASGGSGLYLHPTLVWGPGGRTLLFAMVTAPQLQDGVDRDDVRAGAGIIHLSGGGSR